MVLLVASASLRDKPGYAHFAVAKAGPRVIAQSMAPEYGPRDLRVARVAIGGRIDGDPSTRDSAPSRSAFRIHAPGWGARSALYAGQIGRWREACDSSAIGARLTSMYMRLNRRIYSDVIQSSRLRFYALGSLNP
jgi:NAD(P)-dependent dehydrogenase (short-subunit alcohol dehydrogenase family)